MASDYIYIFCVPGSYPQIVERPRPEFGVRRLPPPTTATTSTAVCSYRDVEFHPPDHSTPVATDDDSGAGSPRPPHVAPGAPPTQSSTSYSGTGCCLVDSCGRCGNSTIGSPALIKDCWRRVKLCLIYRIFPHVSTSVR